MTWARSALPLVLLATTAAAGGGLKKLNSVNTGYTYTGAVKVHQGTLLVTTSEENYAAANLLIYDLSDPANPQGPIGQLDMSAPRGDPVYEIDVIGEMAYLGNHTNGLRIVDLSDPNAPVQAGRFSEYTGDPYSSSYLGLDVVGQYAYVADHWQGLRILDVSNPPSISLVNQDSVDPGGKHGLFEHDVGVSGAVAYMTSSHHCRQLESVDVADAVHPSLIDDTAVQGYARKMALSGGMAYVASGIGNPSDPSGGLEVVDVSDPNAVSAVTMWSGMNDLHDIAVISNPVGGGDLAIVAAAADGIAAVDLSDPLNPVGAGSGTCSGDAHHLDAVGEYAYVSCSHLGTIDVFLVPEPATLSLIALAGLAAIRRGKRRG